MIVNIVDYRAAVTTEAGVSEYYAPFQPGLNVLRARNSWGKSTLLQGMVFALGLEGAFSAAHGVPLTPAMTQAIDLPTGRKQVIESTVAVTLRNSAGEFLRCRRFAHSLERQTGLVQVWRAASEEDLNSAPVREYFVRRPGGATRELGFHRVLTDFLGCTLPSVPAYGGGEALLYLELLLPLFFVEQKFGWSGIAPRVRTNMQVREPLKRGVEFLLGLSTLERIKARNRLNDQVLALRKEWTAVISGMRAACALDGQRISFVLDEPVVPSRLRTPIAETYVGDRWIPSSTAVEQWRRELERSVLNPETAGSRAGASATELTSAEAGAIEAGAEVRRLRDQQSLLQSERRALANRLASIQADRRRLQDVGVILQLGGHAAHDVLADNKCPTCDQDLDSAQTAFQQALSLEDNITFLKAEADVVGSMQVAVSAQITAVEKDLAAAQFLLAELRERIRILRDELTLPASMPSVSQVHSELASRARLKATENAVDTIAESYVRLTELSGEFETTAIELARLKTGDLDEQDKRKIAQFQASFRRQLSDYGLRSVSPSEVTISEDSLLPGNDGFDLTFTSSNMDATVSASDTIRTKWAYMLALYEVASTDEGGRHPGVLVLDEPRQQEIDRNDVSAFIQRLAESSTSGQILYITSEETEFLTEALSARTANFLPSEGNHMFMT